MAKQSQTASGGISFFGLLTIVFIVLKLTNYINWSWWLVLGPLWMPIALFLAAMLIIFIAKLIVG